MNRGFTLLELLIALVVLGILATLSLPSSMRDPAQLELESGLRRLRVGLDRGRLAALRQQAPCALHLSDQGWRPPTSLVVPACAGASTWLAEHATGPLVLQSTLPHTVRFTANGLVLDGGLVLLRHPRLSRMACLVIGLPLGITRTGSYHRDPTLELSSAHCRPNDAG
ncbi:Tfp pilus assembly protein FimT/FimU [Parasynechococcus sp.]|uniref:pilus assembly FimT family protein n=1 Tax=Parasynechococcus sp. TaxID=3101203 RepID=UPI003703D415